MRSAFIEDLASGTLAVEWGTSTDLDRIHELETRYTSLAVGLVDCAVVAVAERVRASSIATLDLRHFGAIEIQGSPWLLPRDL